MQLLKPSFLVEFEKVLRNESSGMLDWLQVIPLMLLILPGDLWIINQLHLRTILKFWEGYEKDKNKIIGVNGIFPMTRIKK